MGKGCKSKGKQHKGRENAYVTENLSIFLPREYREVILGTNRNTLTTIQNDYGVKLWLPGKKDSREVLKITGFACDVQKAQNFINSLIKNHEIKEPLVQKTESSHKTSAVQVEQNLRIQRKDVELVRQYQGYPKLNWHKDYVYYHRDGFLYNQHRWRTQDYPYIIHLKNLDEDDIWDLTELNGKDFVWRLEREFAVDIKTSFKEATINGEDDACVECCAEKLLRLIESLRKYRELGSKKKFRFSIHNVPYAL